MRAPLAVLFAVNVLNFYDRVALGALLEPIRHEFHLSDAQLGALVTWFVIIYALAGVPLGRLADRVSRRRLLAAGVTVWASLTASAGLAVNYTMLLVSRLGVGVGEAVCAPSATSWIGDAVPASRRSRALALFMMGLPVGTMLSFGVSGPVAQAWGWRAALVLAAAPAALLVPAVLALPEPKRGAAEPHAALLSRRAGELLEIPTLRWIIASGALVNFDLYVVATFLPSFLTRWHGYSVATAGLWSGIGLGIGGLLGGLVSAACGDRIAAKDPAGRMTYAAAASLVAAPLACAGILLPRGAAAAIPLLVASYGLLNTYYGLVYASIQDIVEPRSRGTAMSLYFVAMYLSGGAFGPSLTGWLSDLLARHAANGGAAAEAARSAGLHQAMLVIPVFCIGLAAVLWAGSRTIERDVYSQTP
jgi:predicted MFS family arabinose efflux permease